MKKITYYSKAAAVFGIIGLVSAFGMGILQKGVAYFKEPKDLWSYEFIVPSSSTFEVGKPILFLARRTANIDTEVKIIEKLNCDGEYIDSFVNDLNYSKGTVDSKFELGQKMNGKFTPYIPDEELKACKVTSCQFVEYYGIEKSQCYETNLFDVFQKMQ